ncbi:MAG: hypothetical protein U5K00_19505 [Melioribacteraceae bacterium]|nr:hypothetical protein [Melioribacteraceae bacterium]
MVNKVFLYINLLLIFFGSSISQEFRVRVEADSSKFLVGDYINLKCTVTHQEGIKYVVPSIKDSLSELTFIKELPSRQYDKDDKIIKEYNYIFSKYDSAGVIVPSVKFYYETPGGEVKTSYSNEIAFDVTTMDVNLEEEIQDVKSPIRIPLDWLSILMYVLIFVVLAGLAYFIYRHYIKRKEDAITAKPEIIIPPHEEALKALHNLEDEKLWQQGKVKEFHSNITHIIRKYFERRFNFLALEMPSSDLLKQLKEINSYDKLYLTAEEFFNNADMVKFAKFQPMASVNEQMMKEAYEIVKSTKEEVNQIAKETANV